MKTLSTFKIKNPEKDLIYQSKLFSYIDSDFKNWGLTKDTPNNNTAGNINL